MKWRSLEESSPELGARSLADVFAERKQLIARYVPDEVRAIHERVVSELRKSGIGALQVGSHAPEFALPDHNGNVLSSSNLRQDSRLVICFFRGRWCPFCVGQLEAMNSIVPQIRELGASFLAISPQTKHQSYLMADQHRLRFPLLSDAGNAVARQFGLVYRVPDYQQEVYRSAFVNLPFANGDSSWELPSPATYVLDRDSTILFAGVDPDYTSRPEPTDILQFLSQFPEH
ncbi:MAG TPA: peroxiredoxin-like family protein [Terriglobales bacterium]|nr:peroxiredoxin-like family protein [Terriglobales bacterium]